MKHKLSFLLGIVFYMGCYVPSTGSYTVIRKSGSFRWGEAKYQDHDFLVQDVKRVCANALWDSVTCAEELALLPVGGRMVITFRGTSWEEVNPADYEYLIQDTSGKELFRQAGYPREATSDVDQNGKVSWRSVDFMQIPFDLKVPFKFYVIDHRRVRRSEYLIRARNT
jgi:hypothetical protein